MKLIKKIIVISILVTFSIVLVGCDDKKNNNGDLDEIKEPTQYDNYKEAIKEKYGLDIKEQIGWTFSNGNILNDNKIIDIFYTVLNGDSAKKIIENYINEILAISSDGIYSYGYNEKYTQMIKKEKYTDYVSFSEKEIQYIDDLSSTLLVYTYNEKDILFVINIENKKANISFTLLGQ